MTGEDYYHFRFRAETISDVLELRIALYEAEKLLLHHNLASNSFKFAIIFPDWLPDIEVLLSTSYPLEFLTKVMQTLPDSHVMQETITEYANYTGDRTYDSENMDIDVRNIWSIIQSASYFYFKDVELTSEILSSKVIPYTQALTQLQLTMDEISGKSSGRLLIRFIASGSVTISFDGVAQTLDALRHWFRRGIMKAEKESVELQNKKLKIENEQARYELAIFKKQAEIQLDPQLTTDQRQLEVQKIHSQMEEARLNIRKLQLELEQLEIETQGKYVAFAKDFLEPYLTDEIPLEKRIEYITKTARELRKINTSGLEIQFGRPDALDYLDSAHNASLE